MTKKVYKVGKLHKENNGKRVAERVFTEVARFNNIEDAEKHLAECVEEEKKNGVYLSGKYCIQIEEVEDISEVTREEVEETPEESNGGPVVATEVEVADSGLLDDFTTEDSPWSELIIYGNSDYRDIVGDDIATTWDFVNDIVFYMPETVEEFRETVCVPYEYDFIKYGTVEDICKECSDVLHHGKDETDAVINILEILTGKAFKWTTLRGYCQRDWMYCYYPENIGSDIDAIECMYFGKMRHFIVDGCLFEVLDCEDAEKLLKANGVDAVEYINGYKTAPTHGDPVFL